MNEIDKFGVRELLEEKRALEAMVVFLASPEAAFVTGQVVNVCGGRSSNMS